MQQTTILPCKKRIAILYTNHEINLGLFNCDKYSSSSISLACGLECCYYSLLSSSNLYCNSPNVSKSKHTRINGY